jgi:trimeric autotransporter adhesin
VGLPNEEKLMKRVLSRVLPAALVCCGLSAASVHAIVIPTRVAEKSFRSDAIEAKELHQPLSALPALAGGLEQELRALGVQPDSGFFDSRTGRWSSLILRQPLVPGDGYRNGLRWPDGGLAADDNAFRDRAWSALRAFLKQHEGQLRIDVRELSASPNITVHDRGQIIQIHAPRVVNGVPVRESAVSAVINHGNLVILGLLHWGDVTVSAPAVSADSARARLVEHVSPFLASYGPARLEVMPTLNAGHYEMRMVWTFQATIADDAGSWEGIVDAASGDLLAFEDKNAYAQRTIVGGVFPVSNDGRIPDGVEQPGWPMPFATITTTGGPVTSTTGGTISCSITGQISTNLSGPFIRMSDGCGAANEVAATGNLDLGVSGGTDCVVPAGHSVGDTHSSRTGFYELNRIKEQARAHLPANAWLQAQLTANMNIQNTCNAFWSTGAGTVNFYRDNGSACRNTGEIAAVFDHEWGHGMDANGTAGGVSSPGEGIADIYGFLRLNDPCIARGFFKNQVCGGYGDPCDGTPANGCTGIRNVDFMAHACDRPHTVTWITQGFTAAQCNGTARPACSGSGSTPCGRATHCEGKVVGETAFDLARRDLIAAPFNLDANTAHEVNTRLWYILAQPVTSWYTCSVGGGCGATAGYMQALGADDDNGNLNDGTPHMTAIRAAFERHEIHCATPTVTNSGCANLPTAQPVLTATPVDDGVNLSWTAVPNAVRYNVYRTEGVAVTACNFGKVKIAEVVAPATTFSDTNLLAGRPYSYIVIPTGSAATCFGRASLCASATPTSGGACGIVSLAPTALNVDTPGNRVLQPNEGVVQVAPSWQNTGNIASPVTGVASNFTGPVGPTYTLADAAASYGTIAAGATAPCSDCYGVSITAANRPATHWDSTMLETVTPTATTKNWTLHVGDSFTDVPASSSFYRFIETIFHRGITGGCTATTFCPTNSTTREQMSAFVLVAKEGAGYQPPACTTPVFNDVPASSPFCRFIEELARRGVASGCGGGNFCPQNPVTRAQMSVFVLRTLDPALNPPACTTPVFNDVPASDPFCRWIEELVRRGVTSGCGGGNYCPNDSVTREQMSVFLTTTFGLTLYGL